MRVAVQFYRDALSMELLYGGEHSQFSSLRSESAILNLEHGEPTKAWDGSSCMSRMSMRYGDGFVISALCGMPA